MVARSPPKQPKKLMVAPLNPTRIRETLVKVDQCMARLQELQYTVTGGNKVVAGVNLSPRSTRGYLKASLRCKQESLRSKGAKRSPTGKLPSATAGEWRRMSLPAMLLGETVGEVLQASKFAKDIVETFSKPADHNFSPCPLDEPKTPVTVRRKQRTSNDDNAAGGIESRRKREKQHVLRIVRAESNTPALRRARSKINFKAPSPERAELEKENRQGRYSANRVSPRHRPWAKKAVLFPNPLFSSPPAASLHRRFCKTKSPVIVRQNNVTPRKFLIKTPPPAKSKFQVKIKSPVAVAKLSPPRAPAARGRRGSSPLRMVATATAGKLRRSLSPARLASRLMSPLKRSNNSIAQSGGPAGGGVVSGWRQRPIVPATRYPSPRF